MKLISTLGLFILLTSTVQAYDFEDYLRDDEIRTRYNQERFDRMMESSRRSSAVDAMYGLQQQQQTYYPVEHSSDSSYNYRGSQVISKPLDVFGRY